MEIRRSVNCMNSKANNGTESHMHGSEHVFVDHPQELWHVILEESMY